MRDCIIIYRTSTWKRKMESVSFLTFYTSSFRQKKNRGHGKFSICSCFHYCTYCTRYAHATKKQICFHKRKHKTFNRRNFAFFQELVLSSLDSRRAGYCTVFVTWHNMFSGWDRYIWAPWHLKIAKRPYYSIAINAWNISSNIYFRVKQIQRKILPNKLRVRTSSQLVFVL